METYADSKLGTTYVTLNTTDTRCNTSQSNELNLEGFLVIKPHSPDSEIINQARKNFQGIQNIIKNRFPQLNLDCKETTYPINPENDHGVRYSGTIKGKLNETTELIFCTDLHATDKLLPNRQKFQATIPFINDENSEDHTLKTIQALGEMWPYILGFKNDIPRIKNENFTPGNIILIKNGNAVASGDAVYNILNLELPYKPLCLDSGLVLNENI